MWKLIVDQFGILLPLALTLFAVYKAVAYFIDKWHEKNKDTLNQQQQIIEAKLKNEQHIRDSAIKELEIKSNTELIKLLAEEIRDLSDKIKILMEFKEKSTITQQELKVLVDQLLTSLTAFQNLLIARAVNQLPAI